MVLTLPTHDSLDLGALNRCLHISCIWHKCWSLTTSGQKFYNVPDLVCFGNMSGSTNSSSRSKSSSSSRSSSGSSISSRSSSKVGVSACGSLVYEMTIAAIIHNLGPKALLITWRSFRVSEKPCRVYICRPCRVFEQLHRVSEGLSEYLKAYVTEYLKGFWVWLHT